MDKKSKILFAILILAILSSVGVSFYKYVVTKNYQISAEIPCDPINENCFVRTNDDNSTSTYKLLNRRASNIPLCDPALVNCRAFVCEIQEPNCEITNCSNENLPEGENCSR